MSIPLKFLALFSLSCSITTSALGQNVTEQTAETLFPEVRSILAQCITNKTAWSTNTARIHSIYGRLGFRVTIDNEREFESLGFGLEMALQPQWPSDVWSKAGWPTNRQEWLAEYVKRNDFSPIPFSKEAWLQDKCRDRTRYRMFKDFKRTHLVVGMPVEQLRAELGKPIPSTKDPAWISYCVGDEIGIFVIDNQTLDFEIKDGKVASYCFIPH